MPKVEYPYFNYVLHELAQHNSSIESSFGRHVHWGYWETPEQATGEDADYAQAAERLTLELTALAKIEPGQVVLDAGCGFGGTIASLNERFDNLSMNGLNIDMRQIARAQEVVKTQNDNTIAFCQADACKLPYADASIDRVLAVECIFHFPSREAFFREANRVLKPGGVLALSDFIPASVFLPVATLASYEMFSRLNMFGHCDVRHTIGRYRRMAAETGFEPDRIRNITRHTVPTYRYLQSLLADKAKIPGRTEIAAKLVPILTFLAKTGLLNYYLMSYRKAG